MEIFSSPFCCQSVAELGNCGAAVFANYYNPKGLSVLQNVFCATVPWEASQQGAGGDCHVALRRGCLCVVSKKETKLSVGVLAPVVAKAFRSMCEEAEKPKL